MQRARARGSCDLKRRAVVPRRPDSGRAAEVVGELRLQIQRLIDLRGGYIRVETMDGGNVESVGSQRGERPRFQAGSVSRGCGHGAPGSCCLRRRRSPLRHPALNLSRAVVSTMRWNSARRSRCFWARCRTTRLFSSNFLM
jgi:hypothetical protein